VALGRFDTRLGDRDWDEALHPRDRLGRFIEKFSVVSVMGGGRGVVQRNLGEGRIEVRLDDGRTVRAHRNYLTVLQAPDDVALSMIDPAAPGPTAVPDFPVEPDPEPAKPEIRDGEVGMLFAAGEVVRTASGRETTPFPRVDVTTERRTSATTRRVDQWLLENAQAEAESRDLPLWIEKNPRDWSQSDRDVAEAMLFDRTWLDMKPRPRVLKPLTREERDREGLAAADVAGTVAGLGDKPEAAETLEPGDVFQWPGDPGEYEVLVREIDVTAPRPDADSVPAGTDEYVLAIAAQDVADGKPMWFTGQSGDPVHVVRRAGDTPDAAEAGPLPVDDDWVLNPKQARHLMWLQEGRPFPRSEDINDVAKGRPADMREQNRLIAMGLISVDSGEYVLSERGKIAAEMFRSGKTPSRADVDAEATPPVEPEPTVENLSAEIAAIEQQMDALDPDIPPVDGMEPRLPRNPEWLALNRRRRELLDQRSRAGYVAGDEEPENAVRARFGMEPLPQPKPSPTQARETYRAERRRKVAEFLAAATLSDWERTKPWARPWADVEAGLVGGLRVKPDMSPGISAMWMGDHIAISPSMRERWDSGDPFDAAVRRALLWHEAGHAADAEVVATVGDIGPLMAPFRREGSVESTNLRGYGRILHRSPWGIPDEPTHSDRPNEILADAYQALALGEAWRTADVDGVPELYAAVNAAAERLGMPTFGWDKPPVEEFDDWRKVGDRYQRRPGGHLAEVRRQDGQWSWVAQTAGVEFVTGGQERTRRAAQERADVALDRLVGQLDAGGAAPLGEMVADESAPVPAPDAAGRFASVEALRESYATRDWPRLTVGSDRPMASRWAWSDEQDSVEARRDMVLSEGGGLVAVPIRSYGREHWNVAHAYTTLSMGPPSEHFRTKADAERFMRVMEERHDADRWYATNGPDLLNQDWGPDGPAVAFFAARVEAAPRAAGGATRLSQGLKHVRSERDRIGALSDVALLDEHRAWRKDDGRWQNAATRVVQIEAMRARGLNAERPVVGDRLEAGASIRNAAEQYDLTDGTVAWVVRTDAGPVGYVSSGDTVGRYGQDATRVEAFDSINRWRALVAERGTDESRTRVEADFADGGKFGGQEASPDPEPKPEPTAGDIPAGPAEGRSLADVAVLLGWAADSQRGRSLTHVSSRGGIVVEKRGRGDYVLLGTGHGATVTPPVMRLTTAQQARDAADWWEQNVRLTDPDGTPVSWGDLQAMTLVRSGEAHVDGDSDFASAWVAAAAAYDEARGVSEESSLARQEARRTAEVRRDRDAAAQQVDAFVADGYAPLARNANPVIGDQVAIVEPGRAPIEGTLAEISGRVYRLDDGTVVNTGDQYQYGVAPLAPRSTVLSRMPAGGRPRKPVLSVAPTPTEGVLRYRFHSRKPKGAVFGVVTEIDVDRDGVVVGGHRDQAVQYGLAEVGPDGRVRLTAEARAEIADDTAPRALPTLADLNRLADTRDVVAMVRYVPEDDRPALGAFGEAVADGSQERIDETWLAARVAADGTPGDFGMSLLISLEQRARAQGLVLRTADDRDVIDSLGGIDDVDALAGMALRYEGNALVEGAIADRMEALGYSPAGIALPGTAADLVNPERVATLPPSIVGVGRIVGVQRGGDRGGRGYGILERDQGGGLTVQSVTGGRVWEFPLDATDYVDLDVDLDEIATDWLATDAVYDYVAADQLLAIADRMARRVAQAYVDDPGGPDFRLKQRRYEKYVAILPDPEPVPGPGQEALDLEPPPLSAWPRDALLAERRTRRAAGLSTGDVDAELALRDASARASRMPRGVDTPARTLGPGDRFVVPGDEPEPVVATVVEADTSDLGATTVAYRLDDGTARTVVVPKDTPVRKPARKAEEVRVQRVRVSALAVGDVILIDGPDGRNPAEILSVSPTPFATMLTVRYEDGETAVSVASPGDDVLRVVAETAVPVVPSPVEPPRRRWTDYGPPGVEITPFAADDRGARPVLYTYQRRNIIALDVDFDEAASPEARQAAARIRRRQPLSGPQAAALADVLRQQAAGAQSARQARTWGRAAQSLEAASMERGSRDFVPTQDRVEPTLPAALTVGDTAVIPMPVGTPAVVRILGQRTMLRGRLTWMQVDNDGVVSEVLLSRDTRVYLMPDLPEPVRVQPGGANGEWVDLDAVDVGDVLDKDGERVTVVDVVRTDERTVQGTYGDRLTSQRPRTRPRLTVRDDSGKTRTLPVSQPGGRYARIERGPNTQDQPVGERRPEFGAPESVTPDQVRPGDWISGPGGAVQVVAVYDRASEPGSEFPTLRAATLRYSDGTVGSKVLPSVGVERLLAADETVQAQVVRQMEADRLRYHRRQLEVALYEEESEQARRIASAGRLGSAHSMAATLREMRQVAGPSTPSAALVAMVGVDGEGAVQEMREQMALGPVSSSISRALVEFAEASGIERDNELDRAADAASRAVTAAIIADMMPRIEQALEEAQANPLPDEAARSDPGAAARLRVLTMYEQDPPSRRFGFSAPAAAAALATAAEGLRGARPVEPTRGADEFPYLATVPDDAPLVDRVAAYRREIGRFGHQTQRRTVFGPIDLDALERGEPPTLAEEEVHAIDRARDGGPGPDALRDLAAVRAAGKEVGIRVDQVVEAEMAKRGMADWREREARLAAARLRFEAASDAHSEAIRASHQAADPNAALQEHPPTAWQAESDAQRQAMSLAGMDYGDWARMKAAVREGKPLDERERMALAHERRLMDETMTTYPSLRELIESKRAYDQAITDRLAARRIVGQVRRDAALQVLSGLREMGGQVLAYGHPARSSTTGEMTERNALVKAMRWAEQVYPTDWLEAVRSNTRGAVGLGRTTRAMHRGGHGGNRDILLSKGGAILPTDETRMGNSAVHELGHAVEDSVPDVRDAINAFLWDRTSTGAVGEREREEPVQHAKRGRGQEVARKDEFPEWYSGRVYGQHSDTFGAHGAYEVLTTAMQGFMAGDEQYVDDDMRDWLLGALAVLGKPKAPTDGDRQRLAEVEAAAPDAPWSAVLAPYRGQDVSAMTPARVREAAAETFALDLGGVGAAPGGRTTSQVTAVRMDKPQQGSTSVLVEGIITPGGERDAVARWKRRITLRADGAVDVHHVSLDVKRSEEGAGIGSAFIERSIEQYRARGVRGVTVTAAGDVGKYAWAQHGFDWDWTRGLMSKETISRYHQNYAEALERLRVSHGPQLGEEAQAKIRGAALLVQRRGDREGDLRNFLSPKELANLLSDVRWYETPGETLDEPMVVVADPDAFRASNPHRPLIPMWPGKWAMLNGDYWYGRRDLSQADGPPQVALPDAMRDAATPGEVPQALADAVERVVEHDLPSGARTRIATIDNLADSGGVNVTGDILTREGVTIGAFTRGFWLTDDGVEVYHTGLSIDPTGHRIGSEFFDASLAAYRREGVKRVRLTAGGFVGKYAWAQRGFRYSDSVDLSRRRDHVYDVHDALQSVLLERSTAGRADLTDEQQRRISDAMRALLAAADRAEFEGPGVLPSPKELANLLSDVRWTEHAVPGTAQTNPDLPDGQEGAVAIPMWPGKKALLLAGAWDGVLYLDGDE
jgi:hypothetical protein